MRLGDYIGVDIMDDMYWELIEINKNRINLQRFIDWMEYLVPSYMSGCGMTRRYYKNPIEDLIELEIYATYKRRRLNETR
jgi:hypothetical protein